jgi:hypothetical protein
VVCWNDGLQGKPEEIRDEYLKDVQLLFYWRKERETCTASNNSRFLP